MTASVSGLEINFITLLPLWLLESEIYHTLRWGFYPPAPFLFELMEVVFEELGRLKS